MNTFINSLLTISNLSFKIRTFARMPTSKIKTICTFAQVLEELLNFM